MISKKIRKNIIYPVLLFFILFLLYGCAGLFAKSLVYANRQPVIKNPGDYGLKYKNIEFKTPDNITIKGWLIPGSSDSLGVITHPMNFSKYGYSVKNQGAFKITDIEVEFIKTAKSLNKEGHTVLMFDLRNHGESDDSKDRIFGLGLNEWQDVAGALDYINNNKSLSNKKIFFVSFCTGADSTIIAMSKVKNKFKNVKCLVAVQPISMSVFVNNFMRDKYKPLVKMIPSIEKECIKMGGYEWNKMSPEGYVKDILVPVLYVQAKEDKWTDIEFVKKLYDKSPQPKKILLLEGKMHRFDTYNYFGEKPDELINFINKYL